MVELANYKAEHFEFLNYELSPAQSQFTRNVASALELSENSQKVVPITILSDHFPVGFFLLDFGKDKVELTSNPDSVLFRSLSVNPKFQGKGIGSEAIKNLDQFLHLKFPNCIEVVLTVNMNNPAKNIYLKCGYIDTGKTREGRIGTQIIMSKNIKMETVLIQKFSNEPEAEMVRSFLESRGLQVFLFNSHSSSVYPVLNFTIGGIELRVKKEDAEKAETLIREFEGGE